ncbi:MAG: CPBP family intramembrane metalloprotease [Gemmataceae bacterium]|nr:CPBP family intramembrane metalloprotease [Gemmataceae bacterium]
MVDTDSKPSGLRWLALAALAFAMLFPAAMTWLYFVALGHHGGEPGPAQSIAYAVGKTIQFGFPILFFAMTRPSRFGLPKLTLHGWGLAIGFALLTALAMATLYFGWLKHSSWLGDTPQRVREKVEGFGIASLPAFIAFALFLSAIHSLLEEYYWRWFVFGELRDRVSTPPAIVLSALGFMLHHIVVLGVYFPDRFWTLALPFSFGVAFGGAVWAWIYARADSLLPAWASHALIDAAIMVIGWNLLSMPLPPS